MNMTPQAIFYGAILTLSAICAFLAPPAMGQAQAMPPPQQPAGQSGELHPPAPYDEQLTVKIEALIKRILKEDDDVVIFLNYQAEQHIGTDDDSLKSEKELAELFFSSPPARINSDTAFIATIAFIVDEQKTIKKLREYPLAEIQAINIFLKDTDYDPRFKAIWQKSLFSFSSLVSDLAGENKYGLIVKGQIGADIPGLSGSSGNIECVFYPASGADTMRISLLGSGTADYRQDKNSTQVVIYCEGDDPQDCQVLRIEDWDHPLAASHEQRYRKLRRFISNLFVF
jgi:hypothetical protein